MALNRLLTNDGHIHRFTVTSDRDGWEVCEEEDLAVLRHIHREDWHRVERDSLLFELTAFALKDRGWTEP